MPFKPIDPKPDFPKLEKEILKFWEENKIFEKSLEQTKAGKPFTFYDGPPFATGLPHYGHILASTIKDLIPRYQTMRGRFVRRRWGWDCHGLPIEEITERHLKISGKKEIEKIGIKKFNETCRSLVLQYVNEWRKMVRRIARWVDFDNSYKTMDRDYMESVWWAFKQIYDKGLVYEGRKVLLYCPRCETPVSKFEVAMDDSYEMVKEEAVTVKFRIKKGIKGTRGETGNTFLLAWTTTPWTLIGNVALAVGGDIEYAKTKVGDEYFILAKDRLGILKDDNPKVVVIDEEFKGKELVGLEYEPLFDVKGIKGDKGSNGAYKVYPADFVNTEEGTGIVHTAVVYGEEDYELGMKVGLPVVPLIDEKGKFNDKAPELVRGMYFKDSEKPIKEDLEKRGLMFDRKLHEHSYPHCWRCDTMLFYNAIPAWFINIQKIKKDLLKSNKKEINWFPAHLKHGRYEKSVESAPDWNISRNRYWGNPIPVWKCEKCEEKIVVGSIKELGKDLPDIHRPYIDEVVLKCDKCGGEAKRITEIFDSWFEAGSMPFASVHYPFETPPSSPPIRGGNRGGDQKELLGYPAQFVAEYIAQTRAWFYVMHVVGYNLFGQSPFENVVTTGTILAEDGSKMSKSRRNFPDPWEVIEKYGVDSLRFYLMNSVVMSADNLNFSEKELGIVYRKVNLILWNVFNYFVTYANEAAWQPNSKFEIRNSKFVLDRWIAAKTQQLINEVTEKLDSYNTVEATRAIADYLNDLSTWYLRRSRGRKDDEFFATLRHCLLILSKVIAPSMPYLAELIYQNLNTPPSPPFKGGLGGVVPSVHLADWPKATKLSSSQQNLLKAMEVVREAVSIGLAARKQLMLPVRQPLSRLAVESKVAGVKFSPELLEVILAELNVKQFDAKLIDEAKTNNKIFGFSAKGGSASGGPGSNNITYFYLDTTVDQQLKLEGMARSLERTVQEMRKSLGLRVGEFVKLSYDTDDEELRKALELFDTKKTYIKGIEKVKVESEEQEIEGKKIRLRLG
ncbi:MAG: isoleucine--tRNA ligase [Candidatus Doudnabacteria bacterium]|nr:isoleucine--tRNA ligase [Candidatus Doudnabacteria bacterium]